MERTLAIIKPDGVSRGLIGEVIKRLENSIEQVTVIERQIQPLILRMLGGLEEFVALDVPFHMDEREERLQKLRDILEPLRCQCIPSKGNPWP